MRHNPDCLAQLYRQLPLPHLGRPTFAQPWFERLADTGRDLADTLKQYPHVRYEPLDMHYVLLQAQSALGDVFLELLSSDEYSRLFLGLMLVLTPEVDAQAFENFENPSAGVRWWIQRVRVARGAAESRETIDDVLALLREQLAGCPRPRVRLALAEPLEVSLAKQEAVREAYRAGGADAALRLLAQRAGQ